MGALAKLTELQSDADKSVGQTYKQSDGGRGTISYIAGWAVATLLYHKKESVKRKLYKKKGRHAIYLVHSDILYLELLITD